MTHNYDEYINKIEGHGILHLNFKKGDVHFEVSEGERLFEALVLGRKYEQIPFIVSRICGVCPTAHYICAIKALEDALRIEPSETTILLRRLMLAAQTIQSHNLHLFFLALPDYLNLKKGDTLAQKYPNEFHIALNIKRIADRILEVAGGRSIHPMNPVVGGFSKNITPEDLIPLRFELDTIIDDAEYAVDLFAGLKYPKFQNPTHYLALQSKYEYETYDGLIVSSDGRAFRPDRFQKEIWEKIVPYSSAKIAHYGKKQMMVGAIARIFLNHKNLNLRAQSMIKKHAIVIDNYNSYKNVLYQALEILHFVEEAQKIIDELLKKKIDITPHGPEIYAGSGVGAIEAPRGTLYHFYSLDEKGIVVKANIITPTGQSLSNIESDARQILRSQKKQDAEGLKKIETLVRAYDPCLTCSVH